MLNTVVLIKWVWPRISCPERVLAMPAAWATMPSPGSSPAMIKSSVSHTMASMSLCHCFGAQHSWAYCWTCRQESWSSTSLPQGHCFTSTVSPSLRGSFQSLLWLTRSSPSFAGLWPQREQIHVPITISGQAMLLGSVLLLKEI